MAGPPNVGPKEKVNRARNRRDDYQTFAPKMSARLRGDQGAVGGGVISRRPKTQAELDKQYPVGKGYDASKDRNKGRGGRASRIYGIPPIGKAK